MTQHTTIEDFIHTYGITATVEYADSNPNMTVSGGDTMHHWLVTLRRGKRTMAVPFSQGSALRDEPTVEDVLDCLASDSSAVLTARSFEEWCSDFGLDTDSRKAYSTYTVCHTQALKLARFLGDGPMEELLNQTERM